MKLITMHQAGEHFKLNRNQIQRFFYRRGDAPKPKGILEEDRAGTKTKLYDQEEVFKFITGVFESEIIQPDEVNIDGVAKILGKTKSHAGFLFRSHPHIAPKPKRYTKIHTKVIYSKADVEAFARKYNVKKAEPKERKPDVRERRSTAPVDNPAFANSLVVQFLSRADAIRPRLQRTSNEPPKTVRVQLEGDWG